jgi:TonB-linked SusC/RagA family outer membrane protein
MQGIATRCVIALLCAIGGRRVPGRTVSFQAASLPKLIGGLLLVLGVQAKGRGVAQTITLDVQDVPFETVIKSIEQQTNYTFFYRTSLLKQAKKVTIKATNLTLQAALELCFKNQPFTYTISGKIITIGLKQDKPTASIESMAPEHGGTVFDVSGRVVNAFDEPVAGATITVKGGMKSTLTNSSGQFFLKQVGEEAVLVITHVQYETTLIPLHGMTIVKVTLQTKVNSMDELQVIAYGTTTKRMNTGNVSTIKASDIEKQPVSNPLLALEGRVPGLFITQANGFPGSGVTVRIEGLNSIGGGNDPLYVIDGVPFTSQLLPSISTILGSSGGQLVNHFATYGNPLNYINPADIESIEVLKDADATAIYGSRAANGAVLITTKKGKAGELKIEFNIQRGWGKVTRKMELMDRRQYLDMRYEALRNDNIPLSSLDQNSNYDLTVWDTTRSTDWQKELIGGTANYTDIQSKVSGGNSTTSYLIGGGYHKETTTLPGNFNDQKATMHFQVNSASSNQKFKLSLKGSYMVDINQLPHTTTTDLTELALQLPPVAPALYNSDGSINWALNNAGKSTWNYPGNPVAQLLNRYKNKTNNLVGNLTLNYQLLPGLNLGSSFGYTNLQSKERVTVPLTSTAPELRQNTTRIGIYGNSTITTWIIEPQISYQRQIWKGKFDVLIGSTIQQNATDWEKLFGFGYATDDAITDINSASLIRSEPTLNNIYKYNAGFGRITYTLLDKFILNLTGRRDGSSRFGAKNQFHNFGSVGGSWIFSKESFIENNFSFLSFGKISASYGTTGNDQIGDYQFLSLYNSVNPGVPYQGITPLQQINLSNPYLQWEETKKIHLGLDLGFFNEKLLLSGHYFRNRSSSQLLGYQLPATTGYASIIENFPALVQNSGFEFSVSSTNISTKKFRWSTNFNLTIPQNKLIEFPGLENSTYANTLVIGRPITIVKKLHLLGVDPATGVYLFASKSNPFNPRVPDDASEVISTSPVFYGGVQNSFSYRGFQLDFLFQFVKQTGFNYYFGRFPGADRYNQPSYLLERWQNPGNAATHQKYNSNYSVSGAYMNAAFNSDAAYSDASYVRLKNVSLSWQVPEKSLRPVHLQALRIFAQGQNLLTVTNYKGLDPETMSSSSLPPLRVFTVGVQLTL